MKKILLPALGTLTLVAGIAGATSLSTRTPVKAVDSPLVKQVAEQEKTLKNHEARIDNTENDVTTLQTSTSTPPSVDHVAVPAAGSPVQPTEDTTAQEPPQSSPIVITVGSTQPVIHPSAN